jgi:hypothetical protein
MPALVAGMTSLRVGASDEDVDGRDKPGHDELNRGHRKARWL